MLQWLSRQSNTLKVSSSSLDEIKSSSYDHSFCPFGVHVIVPHHLLIYSCTHFLTYDQRVTLLFCTCQFSAAINTTVRLR
ncbi:uncharacterized protein RCC_06609 [Ramularia collo-cygni]|uniref:Uncharacterized protein n=1 Tax=Ramularia collo-cygni TaxID=112498 RepID=A0A2D3UVM1_9PEZI|nr:uncharacterized protein RCC_06609 [Ramularia collo-cygni]CZT20751.1 uncharacterized protein RCC_06609 [Ramularia collo-cygni]